MRQKFVLALVTLGLVFSAGARPKACSCMGPTSACSSVWDYSDVFVATVTAIGPLESVTRRGGESRKVTMRVTESFKGVASGEVHVRTGRGGGDCGYAFETGRAYLVYAYRVTDTGELGTGICSRTAPIERSAEDLTYFRGPFRAPATLGQIKGEVIRVEPELSGGRVVRSPMPGIPIILEGAAGKRETSTGPTGAFDFRVPSGRYAVSARLPQGWFAREEPVHLRDPRGCALVSFYVEPDGRIAGRLVDNKGQPAAFVPIHATEASSFKRIPPMLLEQALTGADGEFELRTLPPGEYVIGLALAHGTEIVDGWLRRPSEEAVHRITLGTGQRVEIGNLAVQSAARLVVLSGQIVDAAGLPQPNTFIDVMPGIDAYGAPHAGPFKTDAKGQFRISVFDGHRYRLYAQQRVVTDDAGTVRAAETNAFTASTGLAPFRIAVHKQ